MKPVNDENKKINEFLFLRKKTQLTAQRKSNFNRTRKKHCNLYIESNVGDTPMIEYSSEQMATVFDEINNIDVNDNAIHRRA